MEIMVSIICLAYNHENYIRQCLDGFVMQKTNFKFEVLIHDDASTDRTADIIREYEKKFPELIKPIYQVENQYSKGVKIIKDILGFKIQGKYMAFCEGDDYWIDEYKLQKQFDVLENNKDCYMCVGKVRCVREHGEITRHQYPAIEIQGGVLKPDLLIGSYNFQTSSYFCRSDKWHELYNPDITFRQWSTGDVAMLIYFAQVGKVYYIDEILSCYRQDSVGSWVDRRTNKSRVEFHKRQVKLWEEYDRYTKFRFHTLLMECINREIFKSALFEKKICVVLKKENVKYLKNQKIGTILQAFFPYTMTAIKRIRRQVRNIKAIAKRNHFT